MNNHHHHHHMPIRFFANVDLNFLSVWCPNKSRFSCSLQQPLPKICKCSHSSNPGYDSVDSLVCVWENMTNTNAKPEKHQINVFLHNAQKLKFPGMQ